MNTIAWIVINAVLLGSAVASVKLAKDLPKELKEEQKQLLSQEKPSVKKAASKDAAKDAKTAKAATKAAQPEQRAPQIRMGTLDDIWKKSLFNPDRTELVETEAPENAEPIQATNSELELGGIAQLGKTPVVIIRMKQQQRGRGGRNGMGGNMPGSRFGQPGNMPGSRFGQSGNMPGMTGNRFQPGNMPGMMGGRFGQNGMPLPPWMQQQQQQQQQPQPQGKKIFRIGDTINDTGYVLKDILPEERACIISRNGRDEKLSIEFGDTQSASRKQDAVNYQKEVIAKAEAAARQNNPQNNQNNQNRWQDRRRMMMGGGNIPGGMPGGFRGGMPGMPGGMQPGGFNRFGNNNGQGGTQPGSGFNRGNFGGGGFNGGSINRGGAPGGR